MGSPARDFQSMESESFFSDGSHSFRGPLMWDEVYISSTTSRILLVEDNENFALSFKSLAHRYGVEVVHCKNINAFNRLKHWKFDVAVVANSFRNIGGIKIAKCIERNAMRKIPILFIGSPTEKAEGFNKWPASVKEFINRNLGAYAVLDAAVEAHEINTLNQGIYNSIGLKRSH